jgi:hypothetical protein
MSLINNNTDEGSIDDDFVFMKKIQTQRMKDEEDACQGMTDDSVEENTALLLILYFEQ